MKKLVINISALIILFGSVFGAYQYFESRYAHADALIEVQQSVQSLQQLINYDHLTSERKSKQDRIWSLQDRYPVLDKAPQAVKEEIRSLQQDILDLNEKIKNIEQKIK